MIVEFIHKPLRPDIHTPHYVLLHSDMNELKEQMNISKAIVGDCTFIHRTQLDGNVLYDIVDVPETNADAWEEFVLARLQEASANGVSKFREWYFNYLKENYITTWKIKEMK
jgi:hypothetical protein